jgi:hypothetical protein
LWTVVTPWEQCTCTNLWPLEISNRLAASVIQVKGITNTGVGKSRFTFVRMEKDMEVMIISIAKIDKS